MTNKPQKCSICKQAGHNKSRCPGITTSQGNNILDIDYILSNQKPVYKDHYDCQLDMVKAIEKNKMMDLRDDGINRINYFYDNIKEAITLIQTKFLTNKKLNKLILLAPPGSGKTMIMDAIAYYFKTHSNPDYCILGDRFSVFTGMSSVLWKEQIKENMIFFDTVPNFKVYHNPDIYKRIDYLIKNVLLLKNHIFLIDELHIACSLKNTIGKEFKRLGLTKEAIEKLNIKFILISATPDIMLNEFMNSMDDDCAMIQFEPGPNYRGFNYFNIRNYKSLEYVCNRTSLINEIKEMNSPKHHFIRVKNIKNVSKLRAELGNQGWIIIDYDQESNKYRDEKIDEVIETAPIVHTIWFIKDMLRASKRLRINKHIGMVIEPFNKEDVTVTAQGLIPRWFGYYTDEELEFTTIIFVCNKVAVEKYKKFLETETYDGINYNSKLLNKSKSFKTHQSMFIEELDPEIESEFDEMINVNREDLIDEIKDFFDGLPSNSGLGACHQRPDGFWYSTKYCDKYDKTKDSTHQDNYILITESMLNKASKGTHLGRGKNDNKLIVIPFYNDDLDINSLKWCCRYFT